MNSKSIAPWKPKSLACLAGLRLQPFCSERSANKYRFVLNRGMYIYIYICAKKKMLCLIGKLWLNYIKLCYTTIGILEDRIFKQKPCVGSRCKAVCINPCLDPTLDLQLGSNFRCKLSLLKTPSALELEIFVMGKFFGQFDIYIYVCMYVCMHV